MPIQIEQMEAEVVPERVQAEPPREPSEREQRARLMERMLRELRLRDERDARWRAD